MAIEILDSMILKL